MNLTLHKSNTVKNLVLFLAAVSAFSFGYGLYDSVFNNFLKETYGLTGLQRSILELPRETPGMLVAFVSMFFAFLCSRRLGALSMIFAGVALLLMAFLKIALNPFLAILFLYSLGQHIFLPLMAAIPLELAAEHEGGKMLGNVNFFRNIAVVLASLTSFLLFRFVKIAFADVFLIAAIFFFAAAILLFLMTPTQKNPPKNFLLFRKEYQLFYILSVLYGCRKQIFLTFAPWVLVSVFGKPTQVIASLLFIGGVAGIFFQPILGRLVDRLGERFILASEAFLLIFVCGGYALGELIFGKEVGFLIAAGCYVADQMLMSVSMARATYLKKIALCAEEVTPTLTLAVSIDHIPSILIALGGGVLWNFLGYQAVFGLGVLFALTNLFFALKIRITAKSEIQI